MYHLYPSVPIVRTDIYICYPPSKPCCLYQQQQPVFMFLSFTFFPLFCKEARLDHSWKTLFSLLSRNLESQHLVSRQGVLGQGRLLLGGNDPALDLGEVEAQPHALPAVDLPEQHAERIHVRRRADLQLQERINSVHIVFLCGLLNIVRGWQV